MFAIFEYIYKVVKSYLDSVINRSTYSMADGWLLLQPNSFKKNFLIDCIPLMSIVQLIDSDSIIWVNQLSY